MFNGVVGGEIYEIEKFFFFVVDLRGFLVVKVVKECIGIFDQSLDFLYCIDWFFVI